MQNVTDPFDRLSQNSTNSFAYKGMKFAYFTPPYFSINDQVEAKERILETYNYREMLLLHGYSGCGKTTILTQLHNKDPERFILISPVSKLTCSELMRNIVTSISNKEHFGHISLLNLTSIIKARQNLMLLFDEVNAESPEDRKKLETIRSIYDQTSIPMVLTGINYTYSYIMQENHDKYFSSLKTRLRDKQMTGMTRTDAYDYLEMIAKEENLTFTYIAIQALADTATNISIGGINAFIKILGKSITNARIKYYMDENHSLPPESLWIRPDDPNEELSFGAKKVIDLPKTNSPIQIDEYQIMEEQEHYRSNFPKNI